MAKRISESTKMDELEHTEVGCDADAPFIAALGQDVNDI
jgi:hypothetical protein